MHKFEKFLQKLSDFGYFSQKPDFLKITAVRIFSSKINLGS